MVYVLFADGFEEIEALTPVDYLRRAGLEVVTLGIGKNELITGGHGISVKVDLPIEKSDFSAADMVILPGGLVGTENISTCQSAIELIKTTYNRGKFVCAICAAPTILAEIGLLDGKNCVCYPSFNQKIENLGGKISVEKSVVRDKNIITAKAAGTSEQFAFELISALLDENAAQKVKNAIYAR